MPQRSQTFDSSGPDVRIRGNAYQVLEKYLAMARDASAAGDRIAAENFYQHAEHYYRVISANGEHNRHQQGHGHGGHNPGQGQGHGYGHGPQQHGHGQDPRANQPFDGQNQNGGYGAGQQPVAHQQQQPQQAHAPTPGPGDQPRGPDRESD